MALTPSFGSIKPSQKQQILESNFLSFNGGAGAGDSNSFAQQYLPEIYEQEVERYGNRTLSGFLRMVGAEMPMTSDQVIWSEQNRLHVAYNDVSNDGTNTLTFTVGGAGDAFVENVISKNQTIVILDPAGLELKALVTESSQAGVLATVEVAPYTAANTGALAATGLKIFVYGSEYGKGSSVTNSTGAADVSGYKSITPSFTQFSNSPVIIRNKYVVSGSDMAQIGWVEVATEDGTSGYLWYLKAESETRLRFEDYLEMSVVEGEKAAAGSGAATAGVKGTQGLFAAIKDRGNTNVGFTAAGGLATFDEILKNLDTQGAIEENMLFLNRQTSLDFDDMLAGVGAADNGIYAGGSSYGVFENSEDMALNLGFSGFRRGSYDFYKTDWKYLNDASTRGAIQGAVASVEGVLIPAGTSTVYDQILGTNIRRPFLHVRYRASQADDRKMKTWLTGSAGGAVSSDLDAMEVNFLSERCLCVQGANNFVLFQGV
jgi:hypothetical protein